jgi:hypothetical protein
MTSANEPLRPLGPAGRATWDAVAPNCEPGTLEILQVACEQLDERAQLRIRVLRDGLPADRRALRSLDRHVSENLQFVISRSIPAIEEDPFERLAAELHAAMGNTED